jgi:hypothetical protein
MKKEDCKWKFEWDYDGKNDTRLYPSTWVQTEWNITLLTKINQTSANICKASLRGGATTIELNSKTEEILKTIEYYRPEKHALAGRYYVIVNEDIEDNIIYLYHLRDNIPIEIKDKIFDSRVAINVPKSECTEEEVKEYEYITSGYVEILNYK